MRAINHALVGGIIGLSVGNPVVALPLAFASHFVLDTVPHHGWKNNTRAAARRLDFKVMLAIDAVLCGLLVTLLYIHHPAHYWTAIFGAFLAASPDLYSLPRFLYANGVGKPDKRNVFRRFHKGIQWFERPIGAVVELTVFISASYTLLSLIQ